ncbi:hypothetical protein B0H17DRAFT_1198102 [Mycena rosella]|uniref:Cryptic loci regulator 2 N-terminal domain-containing protein n=1 Tax=Mycena rosella TaxID=1033263 RepID=A0AAD7DPG4_MYCRO|nr:hypothetical protein B0H17DRAFT_1198102 [Mycena rosella]
MSHRNHSSKHTLPNNPTFIDFPRSDGDSALWPQNTTREVDDEGCVNYMQHVGLDEPLAVKWRLGVGDAISFALKLTGEHHVLRDFPSGYRMFDHHKGKADNPRHDVYLFGSESRSRFRSVPEFIPHAIWLMGDGSEQCKCKYCSKKPQREISSSMGLLRHSQSPSPSRPSRPKPEKIERKKDIFSKPRSGDRLQNNKTYAAVQKTSRLKPASHIQTKNIMLVERNNNLRDACRPPPEGGLPRWFREGELVWCALETSIVRPGEHEGEAIKFWPAIIDEVKLSIRSIPGPAESVAADQVPTPWVARQTTHYKVQFLAISRTYLFPEDKVIPYQSHIVSDVILREMASCLGDDWDLTTETMSKFDPCPQSPAMPPLFIDTSVPFAFALQIGSMLSGFWCLTDEWEAKLSVPPAPTRPIPPPSSLQSAIEFAGTNNAYGGSISTGPRGQPLPPPARVISQTRFQGLWWGGERIWADDLVRLKVPRNCLAPTGAQHIFAPAGPGAANRATLAARGGDSSQYGAVSRGAFMKIDTIFIVDAGAKRECRVSGMLYELADSDWEDPNLPRNVESISSGGPSTVPKATTLGETPSYALPVAPTGYKFRPILAPGYEAIMSLTLISGRYYPRLLQHPQIIPCLNDLIAADSASLMTVSHLWSLEGLFGGYKNSVDPSKYKPHRERMLVDASKDAVDALHTLFTAVTKTRRRDTEMEVDTEMKVDTEMEVDGET